MDFLGVLLFVVVIAYVSVWGYNRYKRVSKYVAARQTVKGAPGPGQTSSPGHRQRATKYAQGLAPQAIESAGRLFNATAHGADRSQWTTAGVSVYKRVGYRVPADNNWRMSVDAIAKEIDDVVWDHYPETGDEEGAAEFTAYLAVVAGEAFVYMLPSSGGEAAGRLITELGK